MAAKVSAREIDSTVERMDSCMSPVEIIILALKRTHDNIIRRYQLWKNHSMNGDWKVSFEINAVSFKERMTGTLSVRETDNLLQRIDVRNWSGEINRLPRKIGCLKYLFYKRGCFE